MSALEDLYRITPYPVKALIINSYGYLLKRKRYTRKFFSILEHYKEIDKTEHFHLNLDKVIEVTKESQFFSVHNEHDFRALPVINKEIVKENYDRISNKKFMTTYTSTGGTTGSPLRFPASKDYIYNQWATFWKFRMIHGISFNDWCAYISGRELLKKDTDKPPYWIMSYPTRQLLLSLVHLNKNTVEMYLNKIKSSFIRWIHSYPSIFEVLTELIRESNLYDLAESLNLSVITTSSEVLDFKQKKIIESIFRCKVRQLYGQNEGVASIFECEYEKLHVDESFSYVEFIRDEESDGLFRIIGTQYHNKAFPLVRYDTSDLAIPEQEDYHCPCGRKSRVVREIAGRVQDFLLLDDNSKVIGPGLIFKNLYNVKRVQIFQDKAGSADFYIVKGNDFNIKDELILKTKITQMLGLRFKFRIIYVNNLKTSKRGKKILVINKPEELEEIIGPA